jgi:hypothetical protein
MHFFQTQPNYLSLFFSPFPFPFLFFLIFERHVTIAEGSLHSILPNFINIKY